MLLETIRDGEVVTITHGWDYEGNELDTATQDLEVAEQVFNRITE